MKKILIPLSFLLIALSSCQETESPQNEVVISDAELQTLLFTREEEKLAHDVYRYAFEKYGLPIFQNIASSESTHVLSVLAVMNSYQILDPLDNSTTPGAFTNLTLKNLYSDLIARVDVSLDESIKVGLLIEEMDIYDLEKAISETDNPRIRTLYANLECGSKNHMRSFFGQSVVAGITYIPEYINQSVYESIVNSPKTSCNVN